MVKGEGNFCKVSVKRVHGDVMLQIELTTDNELQMNWGLNAVQTFGDVKDIRGDSIMLIVRIQHINIMLQEHRWRH